MGTLVYFANIIEFLTRTKKDTYARKGIETIPFRPNPHNFEYIEDDLKYKDTYIGGESFTGEEAIWKYNQSLRAMNYFGRVLGEGFDSKMKYLR